MEVVQIKKTKVIIFIIFLIIIGNIVHLSSQLAPLVAPYIEIMFPDIISDNEIKKLCFFNEKKIEHLINTIDGLPDEEILLSDFESLQKCTISTDDGDILFATVFGNDQVLFNFLKNNVEYIEKNNDAIYIALYTSIDFSRGIVWIETNENALSPMQNKDDIYYTKQLSDNFWIFEERD